MRLAIDIYGPNFKAKIKTMSDKQVQALYFKFKNEGRIK